MPTFCARFLSTEIAEYMYINSSIFDTRFFFPIAK